MKWEALIIVAIIFLFGILFVCLAVVNYNKEVTEQYRIQYNCPK